VSVAASERAQVRLARYEDWASIQDLLRVIDELHATLAPQYFRSATRAEAEWRRLLADPTAAVLVAADGASDGASGGASGGASDGAPVGMLAIRVYDTPADPAMVPRRRGHVETVVVDARHRRRGIGRRLLTEATAWARGQGAVEMVLTTWAGNAAADAFYERLGYQVLSRVLHMSIE
jgi:ribosomal protein S18 acetylase RimI-like enzyme